jgi:hypothetical protein
MYLSSTQPIEQAAALLNQVCLPARLDIQQVAERLGFQPHDITVLVAAKLLRPLGRPAPNSKKYFATIEVEKLCKDREFLDRCTRAIACRWQQKNATLKKLAGG